MIDETFHLTPLDARRYEFGKAIRGYDPERVNQFRDQVAEELERLARVNMDLDAKARGFHEQLRAFRDRDKAINEALVSAQQLRKEIRDQADKEGQLIIREARGEADRLLDEARAEVRRIQDQLVALDRARRAYLAQLRVLIERQLTELTAAEQAPVSVPVSRDGPREAPRVEPLRSEAPKAEAPKAETSKFETPKAEAPKAEAPKPEATKLEQPKPETSKFAPKPDASRLEPPKPETSKFAPKPDASKFDQPKAEAPKLEVPKAEPQRASVPVHIGLFSKK